MLGFQGGLFAPPQVPSRTCRPPPSKTRNPPDLEWGVHFRSSTSPKTRNPSVQQASDPGVAAPAKGSPRTFQLTKSHARVERHPEHPRKPGNGRHDTFWRRFSAPPCLARHSPHSCPSKGWGRIRDESREEVQHVIRLLVCLRQHRSPGLHHNLIPGEGGHFLGHVRIANR